MAYRLLTAFRSLFEGHPYLHRRSNLGDFVALHLYEDLFALSRSAKFVANVESGLCVVNTKNKMHGVKSRRGDGSFGEIIPREQSHVEEGFSVRRGPIATIEIGVEVKILMKAMIKQIDRVASDLNGQAMHIRSKGKSAIRVGIVGVNHAHQCVSFEGDRQFPTNGAKYKHPFQEAPEAIARLKESSAPNFDEFVFLPFLATNAPPFSFVWVDERKTALDYGAALARISRLYEASF